MDVDTYKTIYNELKEHSKIPEVAAKYGISEELALIIYTHRVVRSATRNFYRVKAKSDKLISRWKRGHSIIRLARENDFPPVLMAQIILRGVGYGKKEFWKMVKEPEGISDPRLRKEIKEAVKNDYVYSPQGSEIQRKRGEQGETLLSEWLMKHGIEFEREDDLHGKYPKTPDFLLKKPIKINGFSVRWIESKANFGDKIELRRNIEKQLKPYRELFGPGLVLYWFGHIDSVPELENIAIAGPEFLEKYGPKLIDTGK